MALLTDYKYYKWIALIPGWYIGGFVGAVASYFLVETIMSDKKDDISFEIALLRISTLLIKTDGKVHPEEIKAVRVFFIRTFGRRRANKVFKEIKTSDLRNSTLDQLIIVLKLKLVATKYYSLIQMLYAVASSDGRITKDEDLFIENVGLEFGFSKDRLHTIRNQFVKTKTRSKTYNQKTINAFNVLGLKPGVNLLKIKSAYRELVKEYHPDKLAGMSQGIQDLAKEKFQMIQNAYEYLNKNYV